jgi:proteasome lid subunit RPN8/RPN11
MTDDKVAGEEEYTHKCSAVVCEICGFNRGYAEGRKAAAQDFRELLEMVNRLRHNGRYNGGLKWVVDFEQEFDAWKKARGIE